MDKYLIKGITSLKMPINNGNDGDPFSIQQRKRKIVDKSDSNGNSKKKQKIELNSTLGTIVESIQGDDEGVNRSRKEKTTNRKAVNGSGLKQHKCEFCEYATEYESHMIQHRRKHTGEKPFQCELCAKGFKQKGSLNIHMKIHANEFPFQCALCAKGFSQKVQLKFHMITHANEFEFNCSICRQGFDLEKAKNAHEKTCDCKVFRCDSCNYHTIIKCNFESHMRTHTGEKPFQCELCEAGFSQKYNLKKHMKTHTNEFVLGFLN